MIRIRSLRKTSHLLHAVASTLPSNESGGSPIPPPVTYHALDLSLPELERTLTQLESVNREKFEGKIKVGGLWGDYERGIEFVRRGGLEGGKGDKGEAHPKLKGEAAKVHHKSPERMDSIFPAVNGSFNGNANINRPSLKSAAPSASNIPIKSPSFPPTPTANNQRPGPSPLLLPRHSFNRTNSAPKRRQSTSSLNSFMLDDGPIVELDENVLQDEGGKAVVRGVRHADVELDAGLWKKAEFKTAILGMLRTLVCYVV